MTPEQLAAQLRHPHGEAGARVAENMNASNQPIIANTYGTLALQDGDRVLEIGPGSAGHLPTLLARADGLDYTGLDLSADMVKTAQGLHKAQPKVRFVHGDITQAPLPENHYQAIVAINVVYFWQPLAPALNALWRHLAPGGQLCLGLRDRESMSTLPVFQHGFLTYEGPDLMQALATEGFVQLAMARHPEDSTSVLGQVMHKTGLVITGHKPESPS
ncbi:MAG: class I SAM-dependent methyltransferase [Pseudomonadota bacterium]|nr:class I SAM-dependent methyltransferase [Pseudomonadota bacterium]